MIDVTLNGVDNAGEQCPDEVIYDEDSQRFELVRARSPHAEWEIRVYKPSGAHQKDFYGHFEDAFAAFAGHVADGQGARP